MKKCPNCGQATSRTKDWACQWCGYPLLSESHKEIPKTYEELKEERIRRDALPVTEEAETELEPEAEVEEAEAEPEPEPVAETTPEPEPEVTAATEPEPVVEEAKPEPKTKPKPKPKAKRKRVVKPKDEPEPEPEPGPELKSTSESESTAIEVTVEELHSAFEADKVAAEAQFANKILRVTGVVGRIAVDDIIDKPCIILSSADETLLKNVLCAFDKKHGPELNRLTAGQTATVQGKYDGCTINILMIDCVMVG